MILISSQKQTTKFAIEIADNPTAKKALISESQIKKMLITIFDKECIVHSELIPKTVKSTKLIMWKY
jgi:hypothetical protein